MSMLSAAHQKRLEELMVEIDDFVYDPQSGPTKTFEISSYSLKKALSKEVTKVYKGTGLFTEYQRKCHETVIKKAKTFKQSNFMRGFQAMVPTKIQLNDAEDMLLGFCSENESPAAQGKPTVPEVGRASKRQKIDN